MARERSIARRKGIWLTASALAIILFAPVFFGGFSIVELAVAFVNYRLKYVITDSGEDFSRSIWLAERRCNTDEYWHCYDEPTATQRCRMIDDLMQNYLRIGETSPTQVAQLLGPYAHTAPHYAEPWQCISYDLGYCAQISPFTLQLCFDSDGVLADTEFYHW